MKKALWVMLVLLLSLAPAAALADNTVSVNVANGEEAGCIASINALSFPSGGTVALNAIPAEGWAFDYWDIYTDDVGADIGDIYQPRTIVTVYAGSGNGIVIASAHFHKHTGGTATCVNRAVCSICGCEYGEWGEHVEGIPATCTQPAVCKICGQSYGESLGHCFSTEWYYDDVDHWKECTRPGCYEMIQYGTHSWISGTGRCRTCDMGCLHEWGEWTVLVSPTCTEPGEEQRVCFSCKKTETRAVEPLKHSFPNEWLRDGKEHWKVCDREGCNTEAFRAAHVWDSATGACSICGIGCDHQWKDPTCTEPKTCAICKLTEGAANGHVWKPATCTEPKTCAVCGATEGNPNGHQWKDATCTEPKICTVCKATEGKPNGHQWKDATCTEPKICTVCQKTEGRALGHNWKPATCTEPRTCRYCKLTEGTAKGHSWKDATCTDPGRAPSARRRRAKR